jgi:hypothetical protein
MPIAQGAANPAVQACLGSEEAAQDAITHVLKVSSVCAFVSLIRAIYSFLGFGLARLEPYQVNYIVRELMPDQVYSIDSAHLKYLVQYLQANTILLYHKVCFLDKLKSKTDCLLHRLALNIVPALPFHTNW